MAPPRKSKPKKPKAEPVATPLEGEMLPPEGSKGGRPPHVPTDKTRALVESYAAVGTKQEDIALILQIDDNTLRKHYREELDTAEVKANAEIAGALFKSAKEGNVEAQKFWLSRRAKWKEEDAPLNGGGSALKGFTGKFVIEFVRPGELPAPAKSNEDPAS